MTEHTELTAERLSDVEVTKIAWDAEKCCSGHARCDDFERAINKALDMQAKLANVAKANLGAGGAVAERVAQLTAHRACHNQEQDMQNGKLAGYCIVCGVPWPCEYAGKPPATPSTAQGAMPEEPTINDGGVEIPWRDLTPHPVIEYAENLRAHCLALKG